MPYYVTLVRGVVSNTRRGIAFLESDTDDDVNAREAFEELKAKNVNRHRDVLARFDHWLGGEKRDNYHHGWPNDPDRKNCYTFKWKTGHPHHRLYGFLCHPRKKDQRFQACVLTSYAEKNDERTDPAKISTVKRLSLNPEVIRAVEIAFS
jgi:hypothetical protein